MSITKQLNHLVETKPEIGYDNYLTWSKLNPEELWFRILTHTTGNRRKRSEMAGKMWILCDTMENIMARDMVVSLSVETGNIGFDTLEEMKHERTNLITIVEQAFSDILKTIE